MIDAGLILEGGGMRGIYTAGVLDYLLDSELRIAHIYGVSAGSGHACSYVSGQRGRALRAVLDYVRDPRYSSFRSLLTTGDFFGVKMVYDEIPNKLLPFDYDAFEASGAEVYAVLTNCRTGQAEYKRVKGLREGMSVIQASSSLPLLSRRVEIDGEYYLDGGIADSIPLARSIADGNRKNLVVLTQHRGYRKGPSRSVAAIELRYRRNPRFVESARIRYRQYNSSLDLAYAEEEKGNAFILQPKAPVEIGRLEKDLDKLKALYQNGYDDAKAAGDRLRAFLGGGAAR